MFPLKTTGKPGFAGGWFLPFLPPSALTGAGSPMGTLAVRGGCHDGRAHLILFFLVTGVTNNTNKPWLFIKLQTDWKFLEGLLNTKVGCQKPWLFIKTTNFQGDALLSFWKFLSRRKRDRKFVGTSSFGATRPRHSTGTGPRNFRSSETKSFFARPKLILAWDNNNIIHDYNLYYYYTLYVAWNSQKIRKSNSPLFQRGFTFYPIFLGGVALHISILTTTN